MSKMKQDYVLPVEAVRELAYEGGRHRRRFSACSAVLVLVALGVTTIFFTFYGHLTRALVLSHHGGIKELGPFYHSVMTHDDLCAGGVSHSGYIGLQGDSEDTPKRSFFWCVTRPPAKLFFRSAPQVF
ncbi:uncharacterized protein PHACADRAFT_263045 [Phanerochaete carnosa HHB-10118-sp]|uniref:Uncharacterized protein n=1 Tax=Phanerochaete carnosa (strain HHB-10118-sp) TaxID=650164 RepID=K5UMY4_PHACS|nr:uncharacterized protein PHACADRAFT_263045 [Phanerochaete carnosa HHB-10118-sp]EKM51076.1 hypothetical protein PHACADRAFT_263045 [Phanerochaete carnosa HHB-10118-sp]